MKKIVTTKTRLRPVAASFEGERVVRTVGLLRMVLLSQFAVNSGDPMAVSIEGKRVVRVVGLLCVVLP